MQSPGNIPGEIPGEVERTLRRIEREMTQQTTERTKKELELPLGDDAQAHAPVQPPPRVKPTTKVDPAPNISRLYPAVKLKEDYDRKGDGLPDG